MPLQQPQWTEFLSCPICTQVFNGSALKPISLACSHTICKSCLSTLQQKKCPFDQSPILRPVDQLPVNFALLQLVGCSADRNDFDFHLEDETQLHHYLVAEKCIEDLALYLKPLSPTAGGGGTSPLSRPMQRKLVALIGCQLVEEEGRGRALRVTRSLGERTVTEFILQHQNPQQLSANLWAAVRARGCQFLGPAMQEEVLKLILLALEDGSALSRKVLVLFVVQRLEPHYPQASKTAIGHVVQLLYRASCFKVTKREEESSLMQLKEEFRTYEMLRREHDAQIVQIATEAGLRISPEQWSSLLYGDTTHKSHMQSIIDKLQTPQSFSQSINELVMALQRTGDPDGLAPLRAPFELLASIDPGQDSPAPSWETLEAVLQALLRVVKGLADFMHSRASAGASTRSADAALAQQVRYKTSLCRDLSKTGSCPRGANCTFAHSQEELERHRARSRRLPKTTPVVKPVTSSALTAKEKAELVAVSQTAQAKLQGVTPSASCQSISSAMVYQSVTIPIASPSCLPLQAKAAVSQNSIYTSPAHLMKEHQPNCVPITHKAPTYIPTTFPIPARSSGPLMAKSGNFPPPNNDQFAKQGPPRNSSQAGYHVGPTQVRNRGKSPSQQLEELQQRRSELLSQLWTTEPSPTTRKILSTVPDIPMETINSPVRTVFESSSPYSVYSTTLSAALASCSSVNTFGPSTLYSSASTTRDHSQSSPSSSWASHNTPPVDDYQEWTQDYEAPIQQQKSPASSEALLNSVLTSMNSSIPYSFGDHSILEDNRRDLDHGEEDDFIPFDQNIVSKYGPISRGMKTKLGNTAPLQVTANLQRSNTNAVTAVTPLARPYPMASEVPTRFGPQGQMINRNYSDHMPDPGGRRVASSLPTAMIKPAALANTKVSSAEQLSPWHFNEQILYEACPQGSVDEAVAPNGQVQNQLAKVCRQIHSLEICENQRLARELQSIELNIQETERQMHLEDYYRHGGHPEASYHTKSAAQQAMIQVAHTEKQ